MANENIKGITIQIGGDTSGLDKALKGVNDEIKTTQTNLKLVDKALKLDPKNTELVEQKQRLLGKAVEETERKLNALKQAQKEAADQLKNGDIGQEAYDELNRRVVFATKAFEDAKKAANDFNASTANLSASLDGVSTKAKSVADATRGLSAAAGGLLVALGGAAVNSAKYADDLNTLSAQTGISAEDLQKMQYAADRVDVDVDTIAGAMSKMRKSMVSDSGASAEAFARIGVSVRDSSGQLRDSSTVFYEVLQGLSRVGNETERDALAMDIFGRSADQLAGIVDDGGAALKALGQEAEDMGLILDEQTLGSLNAFNDQLDQLKAQATAEIVSAGASALEALSPILETIIGAVSRILQFIGDLDPKLITAIATIAAIVAAISPVASIIGTISGAIAKFLTYLPAIKAAFAAVSAFVAANPLVLIGVAVGALVAAIITHWDKIKPILAEVWEKIKDVATKVADVIKGAIEKVQAAFQAVKDFFVGIWETIKEAAKEKINAIIGFVNKGIEAINKFTSKINESGVGKFFGINIGQISTIPALAGGGVLQSGSALVGERGPELLTMRNGAAAVQPLSTTTNTYNTINQTSRQPVQINLVLDGMVAARALYDPLRAVSGQRGPSFVK